MKWLAWSLALCGATAASAMQSGAASRETESEPIGPGPYRTLDDATQDDGVPLPVDAVYQATPQGDAPGRRAGRSGVGRSVLPRLRRRRALPAVR